MVVFDRLLAHLMQAQPDAWVLKGDLALQLRLGSQARTTKDMDVLLADLRAKLMMFIKHSSAQPCWTWEIGLHLDQFEIGLIIPGLRSGADWCSWTISCALV